MEKKKRKRIARRVVQISQKDNYFDIGDESEYDSCSEESMGQALKVTVQSATRLIHVSSKKESESSNNPRQHYRSDGREKIGYASLIEAKLATVAYWDKNEDMREYKCTICDQFHIGHKKGAGHSIAYKIYKGVELAGLLIDCVSAMKRLFAKGDSDYPHLPLYHDRKETFS